VDYEKAYDNLNRRKLWQILREENIPTQLLKAIQSLYQNSNIHIKYIDGPISEPINANKGVRQGCGLSPELFNIYINRVIQEWKQTTQNGIQVTSGKVIQTILYADDQVIIAKSENELQMVVNKLHKIAKKYDMKISTSKTKAIGVCGKNIQRVKIEIEGKIIEQVSNFNYLGSLVSNEEKDINAKLQRYNKMNGIIK
jgi:hypothetical protein